MQCICRAVDQVDITTFTRAILLTQHSTSTSAAGERNHAGSENRAELAAAARRAAQCPPFRSPSSSRNGHAHEPEETLRSPRATHLRPRSSQLNPRQTTPKPPRSTSPRHLPPTNNLVPLRPEPHHRRSSLRSLLRLRNALPRSAIPRLARRDRRSRGLIRRMAGSAASRCEVHRRVAVCVPLLQWCETFGLGYGEHDYE
ncbi:hypothetical protein CB0940_09737 [Cercospora beticola]|uniref:Uncharacterized protein n=1 Tax=Cercospora beticola TaxID=122368 RepID=A0A2G5HFU4_CERBT|nr:hypothetical protein CB0940_09737 [Cercospora beticola]PIA91399.1 hypothetical protein CB0940_09737 [Cercospora beticola]